MADERDKSRRPQHRDYARTSADTPRAGAPIVPPLHGVTSGEVDSDDQRMAEHFEDDTPVEVLKRIERKLHPPTVEVDAAAFDADIRWKQFDELRAEVAECKREREERTKRAKWLNPLRNVGVGTLIAALLWTVRALSQHGADEEKARQRNAQVEQNRRDIREIQDWRIGVDILMGLRRFTQPTEPDRSDP
jgi:hypothetical protein